MATENQEIIHAQMESTVNEIYIKLATACDGYPLPGILIAAVALLKSVHDELLSVGAVIPADLATIVTDLSAGLVQNEQQAV